MTFKIVTWLLRLESLYYPSISRILQNTLGTCLDNSVKKNHITIEASNSYVRIFSNDSISECSHQTIKRKRRWWSQSITSREPFTTFPIGPLSVWWYGVLVENCFYWIKLQTYFAIMSMAPPLQMNNSIIWLKFMIYWSKLQSYFASMAMVPSTVATLGLAPPTVRLRA